MDSAPVAAGIPEASPEASAPESAPASCVVLRETERLRVLEFRAGPGADVRVTHALPTVRWQVLDGSQPTPMPEFFAAGSAAQRRGERREFVFEFLSEPRCTAGEVRALLAAPTWPTEVGSALMLENEYCRMWDFRLCSSRGSAGEGHKSEFHQHCLDNAFVVIGESRLNLYVPSNLNDPSKAEPVFQCPVNLVDGQVVWTPVGKGGYDDDGVTPKIPACLHSIDNAGDDEFREYLIELK